MMWGKLQIIICQLSAVHVPASIRWLRNASVFSSLFWYVSDWWECADIVRFMNVSFCICEGWSLISAGRGAVGVSASVALIQFLKCVKLLIQYKPLQVHLVLTLVCVCVLAGDGLFWEQRNVLWKAPSCGIKWKWLNENDCHFPLRFILWVLVSLHLTMSLVASLCFCIDYIESLLIKT